MFKKGEKPPIRRQRESSSAEPLSWAQHLEANRDAIFRRLLVQAKKGESSAMRIVMGSLLPRQRTVAFRLPPIEKIEDAIGALKEVAAAVANGQLSPDEAASMADVISSFRSIYETVNLERRVLELESLVRSRLTNA
jgi:hypothetical protein